MKVGVTGAGGLLGSTMVPLWRRAGAEVVAWRRADLDVTDEQAVLAAIADVMPDVVVHAAGYTAVDRAEAEPNEAMRVNGQGTANVCRACEAAGARVVYLSTDYVFDGYEAGPIAPDAAPAPLGAYGRSKAEGERAVRNAKGAWLIVRTGWTYGPGGQNFVDAMRMAAVERRPVRVVSDQRGAPTATRLIAESLWGLLMQDATGVWHVMASGLATWFDVARAVFEDAGAPAGLVTPCTTEELGRPAQRPANSRLDCGTTEARIGFAMPHWRQAVRRYIRTGLLPANGVIGGGDV
ncbi:MAG: dTDP-4-dehydrorhamnose reductase [Gemmatimonadota bacterium]